MLIWKRQKQRHENLQKWQTIACKVLDLLIPAGSGKGRWRTPRVIVESKEIRSLIITSTVHVQGSLETVGLDIRSGVTDWDGTVSTSSNVCPDITRDGLDPWCYPRVLSSIDDLVSGEESKGVVV